MNTGKRPRADRDASLNSVDGMNDVNTRPVTKDELAYRDRYVQGRNIERSTQYARERTAENSGLISGIVLGGILAASIGVGVAVWAYTNRTLPSTTQPQSTSPISVPASPKPNVVPTTPTKQTTVIERTIEKAAPPAQVKVIEVPQAVPAPVSTAPAPADSSPSAPAVSVPSSSNTNRAPAPENAPAPSNQAPSTQSSSGSSQDSSTNPNTGNNPR